MAGGNREAPRPARDVARGPEAGRGAGARGCGRGTGGQGAEAARGAGARHRGTAEAGRRGRKAEAGRRAHAASGFSRRARRVIASTTATVTTTMIAAMVEAATQSKFTIACWYMSVPITICRSPPSSCGVA